MILSIGTFLPKLVSIITIPVISNIYLFVVPISVLALGILLVLLPGQDVITKLLIVLYAGIDTLIAVTQQIVMGLGLKGVLISYISELCVI